MRLEVRNIAADGCERDADLARSGREAAGVNSHQAKQHEVDWDAKQIDGLRCVDAGRGCRRGRNCEQDT